MPRYVEGELPGETYTGSQRLERLTAGAKNIDSIRSYQKAARQAFATL